MHEDFSLHRESHGIRDLVVGGCFLRTKERGVFAKTDVAQPPAVTQM
jgi:hypothetical protein